MIKHFFSFTHMRLTSVFSSVRSLFIKHRDSHNYDSHIYDHQHDLEEVKNIIPWKRLKILFPFHVYFYTYIN